MGSRACLVGTEVPVIGSDAVKWSEVSVPSSSLTAAPSTAAGFPSVAKETGSCSVIGDPPTYLIWKTSKSVSNVLEIIELSCNEEFPRTGLRIVFPDVLFPFALICKNENSFVAAYPYMLYTMTISGVAYLIRLKNISTYASSSQFPSNEVVEYNTRVHPHYEAMTAVSATAGFLVVGRNDGSIGCYQLGMLDPNSTGFAWEWQDDAGFGRLWGMMSRSRTIASVQDLVILEVVQKKLLFVLHADGVLRVWDILNRCKIFTHALTATTTGASFRRLWVGEANADKSIIPLAVLCKYDLGVSTDVLSVRRLGFSVGDKISLSLEPSVQNISLEEGGSIDVKLTPNKIWMLKEDGLTMHELFQEDMKEGLVLCYTLQEAFVADQLFQSSEHSSDDLLWLSHTVSAIAKDQIAPVVSSIFMRRLLLPGVYDNSTLRTTLREYHRKYTDSEFDSLTVEGIKSEIMLLIEHEGSTENLTSIVHSWKTFCTRYFCNWCKENAPIGLLIDSSRDAVGLIRKHSISLCRYLEDIESLIFSSFDDLLVCTNSGLDSFHDLERDILFEVLHCISNLNQQLGKASSAIFYESLLRTPSLSYEEVISPLLKILQSGSSSSMSALHMVELGADLMLEKDVLNHKNLRKFSMDMFLSLHSLCSRASTWSRVFDVIESYTKYLVPRKIVHTMDSEAALSVKTSTTVQATLQVAKVMFESALDVLMLLNYMVNISGQIQMSHDDVSRIKLELVPMIQEIITEWHIINFFGTTPSEAPAIEDFSSRLSSLQLDTSIDKRSWSEKLGNCEFTLAFFLLVNIRSSSGDQSHQSNCLPTPDYLTCSVREFTSWIMWGRDGEESLFFFSHSIELALILLRYSQYDAVEYLLTLVDAHSHKEKTSASLQSVGSEWSKLLHLLGCCLIAQTQREVHGMQKERKVDEAVCCFFRAASAKGAPMALQSLSHEAGWPHLQFTGNISAAAWKLQYYQWVMQIFEQYNMSEAACKFAFAALEQVDDALGGSFGADPHGESTTAVKGRLWANVFKFTLDCNHYNDAYCAIITNPDEESKNICLRRFIIVLYERGALKTLAGGQLPFIGLEDKVERELAWKAERSHVSAKPNPFRLLYAFEMQRNNWRRAARYMYMYSAQLKSEATLKDHQHRSLLLQESLNGLSATINTLQLINPAYAWIDSPLEESFLTEEHYPCKKPRITMDKETAGCAQPQKSGSYVDIKKLENEFVLTSAEYLLSLANVRWTSTGDEKPSPDIFDLLVETNLYDMAFTVTLKFWKGSGLKRELERIFMAMSMKCCPSVQGLSSVGKERKSQNFLLASSQQEIVVHGSPDLGLSSQQTKGSKQWDTLKFYLEKYKGFHPRLPLVIAETLLAADPHIELPLWLVQMFKGIQKESNWGMMGDESNPASLFRLYVDYGRFTEATNLLLEYIDSLASMRPADIIKRKRPSAVWFPYTTIEQLWCQLEESIKLGHRSDQSEKLKNMLHKALLNHLNLLRIDSEDVQSFTVQ